MVSFRFHLVSLTAVFLALAIGIAMGATVVDRVTVEAVENQLTRVERNSNQEHRVNANLGLQVRQWEAWAADADDTFVRGRLAGMPVVVVATRGTPTDAVKKLEQTLVAAGASLGGTIWLTPKFGLSSVEQTSELAQLVGTAPTSPEVVRRAALAALGRQWLAPPAGNVLERLRTASYVEFERSTDGPADVVDVVTSLSRTVVVSSDKATVANPELAIPFAESIAGTQRVLAVDVSPLPAVDQPGAPFATALRETPGVAAQISTVDTGDDPRGRISTVVALANLALGRFGHYGFAAHAQRVLPPTEP
jgi:hypothetical protein